MIQDDKYSISTSIYSISTSMFKSILSSKYWCSNYDAGEQISWLKYYGGVEGGLDVFNLSLKSGLVNFIISRGILQVHGIFSSWLYKGLQLIVLTDFIPALLPLKPKREAIVLKRLQLEEGSHPFDISYSDILNHILNHLYATFWKNPFLKGPPLLGVFFHLFREFTE